ncbi:MAG: hypothetical protein SGI88_21160 [Candidatus Hydrogenedentes bacterium]|nr:hypothetical protein [Candidatus Hydrogenedentota bacterium]
MAGIQGIAAGATGGTTAELAVAYQAAVLRKQIEAVRDVGTAALTLIQSAVADPAVGQHLNIAA